MPGRFKSSRNQNDFGATLFHLKLLQTSKKRLEQKVWNRILRSFLDVFSNTDPSKRSLMLSELAEPLVAMLQKVTHLSVSYRSGLIV